MWAALILMLTSTAVANPSCVMLTFTDDTRYDRVNTAAELSDDVMVKLINSDKFNLGADYPIEADIATHLYDEKVIGYETMKAAFESDDFDAVFEEMLDGRKAQSIATAQVGQIISPELTAKIGKKNNAEYLIQGTIINLGVGNWMREDYSAMSAVGMSNPIGSVATFDVKKSGLGVQCDVRVIKASTGEIVWSKRVVGVATQKMIDMGLVKFGRKKLNDALREKALDEASTKIVAALIDDLDAGQLFVR